MSEQQQETPTPRTGTAAWDASSGTITVTLDDGSAETLEHTRLPVNSCNTLARHGWVLAPGETAPHVTGTARVVSYPEPAGLSEMLAGWVAQYGHYQAALRAAGNGTERVVRYLVITDPEAMILEGDALRLEAPDPNGRLFEIASKAVFAHPLGIGRGTTLAELISGETDAHSAN